MSDDAEEETYEQLNSAIVMAEDLFAKRFPRVTAETPLADGYVLWFNKTRFLLLYPNPFDADRPLLSARACLRVDALKALPKLWDACALAWVKLSTPGNNEIQEAADFAFAFIRQKTPPEPGVSTE